MPETPQNLAGLVGQQAAVGILRAALREERVSHAYLFAGPAGVGKLTAALLFAKALNCENRTAAGEACNVCKSCVRFEHGNHPQIWRIAPMYRRQPITDPRLLELVEDQAWITIAQTRGDDRERLPHPPVLREAMRKPIFSPYKVFIFEPADRMTEEAADSLLYTLEEPPAGTVFILVTSRPAALRETVVSRCEQVRFRTVAPKEIEELLLARGVDANTARLITRLSDGRPGRAVTMAERPSMMEMRSRAVELADRLFDTSVPAALVLSSRTQEIAAQLWEMEFEAVVDEEREEGEERVAQTGSASGAPKARGAEEPGVEAQKLKISYTLAMRRAVPQILNMIAAYLRDIMVVKSGRPDLIVNTDSLERAQARAAEVSLDTLGLAIDRLSRTEGYIRSYANLDSALEALYVELLDAFGTAPAAT